MIEVLVFSNCVNCKKDTYFTFSAITAYTCPTNILEETVCYDLGSSDNAEKRPTTLAYLKDEDFRKSCDEFGQDIIIKKIPVSIPPDGMGEEPRNYLLLGSLGKIGSRSMI